MISNNEVFSLNELIFLKFCSNFHSIKSDKGWKTFAVVTVHAIQAVILLIGEYLSCVIFFC